MRRLLCLADAFARDARHAGPLTSNFSDVQDSVDIRAVSRSGASRRHGLRFGGHHPSCRDRDPEHWRCVNGTSAQPSARRERVDQPEVIGSQPGTVGLSVGDHAAGFVGVICQDRRDGELIITGGDPNEGDWFTLVFGPDRTASSLSGALRGVEWEVRQNAQGTSTPPCRAPSRAGTRSAGRTSRGPSPASDNVGSSVRQGWTSVGGALPRTGVFNHSVLDYYVEVG